MYNMTSLRPSRRSMIIDRDYLAHVARWSHVVHRVERRDHKIDRPYVILDVGCGVEAPLAAVLAGHAYLARGRPLKYEAVDAGPIRPLMSASWMSFYPFTDAVVWRSQILADLVVCFEVLEHMPRSRGVKLLSALRQMVRDDGVVLLSTPVRARTLPRNHIYEWSLDELENECRENNFSVDKVYGTFMDVSTARRSLASDPLLSRVWEMLADYHSAEVLSCVFAPLFPETAKSVFLVLVPTPISIQ